ncbi:MAG: site-2 protease family protein [Candidatus Paceibacter sp.]|nr:site-2 protease family protein [Candidatus Paceibacter sp.]
MNPLKHLDLMGSFVIPLMLIIARSPLLFGWAKPVPYNPYNLKNPKWGPAIVAASGPASNFLVAAIFALVAYFLPIDSAAKAETALGAVSNIAVGGQGYLISLYYFSAVVVWINVFLGIFNLIPIPPLDGSKVLFTFLPYRLNNIQEFMEKYGFFILLFFLLFLSDLLLPVVFFIYRILLG